MRMSTPNSFCTVDPILSHSNCMRVWTRVNANEMSSCQQAKGSKLRTSSLKAERHVSVTKVGCSRYVMSCI